MTTSRRGFLRTMVLGFAGITLAAKLRIDATPVALPATAAKPEWASDLDRYFQSCRDRMQAQIMKRLAETNPYADLFGNRASMTHVPEFYPIIRGYFPSATNPP